MSQMILFENGGRWLVEVLSDNQVKKDDGPPFRVVVFRCLKTLRQGKDPIGRALDIPVGKEVTVEAREGFEAYVGWHLFPDDTGSALS